MDEIKGTAMVGMALFSSSKSRSVDRSTTRRVGGQFAEVGMQHLVVQDETDDIFRDEGIVEATAENDRVMRRIVVTKAACASGGAPTQPAQP